MQEVPEFLANVSEVRQEYWCPAFRLISERGEGQLNCCSIGCASGEPYSLKLLWQFGVTVNFPAVALNIVAVDADEGLLQRARAGRYTFSGLKELPEDWRRVAFDRSGGLYCLKPEFRTGIEFRQQDIREGIPSGPFDLLLCRNVVFTYFDVASQRVALARMLDELRDGGALVIGPKESLPLKAQELQFWNERLHVYRKTGPASISPTPFNS